MRRSLLSLLLLLVAGCGMFGVGPTDLASEASAEWRPVYPGMGRYYGWYENGILQSGKIITGEKFDELKKVEAAVQMKVGSTGQNVGATFDTKTATKADSVVDRIKSWGTRAKGSVTGAAVRGKLIPALSAVGKLSNVATAGWLGWQIGTAIRNLARPTTPPTPPEPETELMMKGIEYVDEGKEMESVVSLEGGGSARVSYAPATTCAIMKKPSETLGSSGCTSIREFQKVEEKEGGCNGAGLGYEFEGIAAASYGAAKLDMPPDSWQEWGEWQETGTKKCRYRTGYVALPLLAASLGLGDGFGTADRTTAAPAGRSPEQVESNAEGILEDPRFDDHTKWTTEPEFGYEPGYPEGFEYLPVTVPNVEAGEKWRKYNERLEEVELVPQPIDLGENANPAYGPEEVVQVNPKPGTELKPGQVVKVRHNPASMPDEIREHEAPAIPAIDLTPLGEIGIGCEKFPFGIFCWLGEGLTAWDVEEVCPNVTLPIGETAGVDDGLAVDFCLFEPAMTVVRPILVLLATFSLGWLFAATSMGLGGKGDDD